MKQQWRRDSGAHTYKDQFGFCIEQGTKYTLSFQGEQLLKLYSLEAAKMISLIILNDRIENKNLKLSEL